MKWDELQFLKSNAQRPRLVVEWDEQAVAGVVVGEEQLSTTDNAQTGQWHEFGVVRHNQHVASHLLDVLSSPHDNTNINFTSYGIN